MKQEKLCIKSNLQERGRGVIPGIRLISRREQFPLSFRSGGQGVWWESLFDFLLNKNLCRISLLAGYNLYQVVAGGGVEGDSGYIATDILL